MQDHSPLRFSPGQRRIVLIVMKASWSYGRCMSIMWSFERTPAFLSVVWLNECVIVEYFVLNCMYCSWIEIITNKPYVLYNYQLMLFSLIWAQLMSTHFRIKVPLVQ